MKCFLLERTPSYTARVWNNNSQIVDDGAHDSTNLNQRSTPHMPSDADAHNDADVNNDDTTAGSGEFIPSLTCRVSQKMPTIPSKSTRL